MTPKWTVITNINSDESDKWVGRSFEFFDEQLDAQACYERHIVLGNVPTLRPWHENDRQYMHPSQQ